MTAVFLGALAGIIPSPHTIHCYQAKKLLGFPHLLRSLFFGVIADFLIIIGTRYGLIQGKVFLTCSLFGCFFFYKKSFEILSAPTKLPLPKNFSNFSALKAHFLNPNPYIFWAVVAPVYTQANTWKLWIATFLIAMIFFKVLNICILEKIDKFSSKTLITKLRNISISSVYFFLATQTLYQQLGL